MQPFHFKYFERVYYRYKIQYVESVERSRKVMRGIYSMATNQTEITELTDILDKDIEAIVAMRLSAERKVNYHQRLIERATSGLGRPLAVYVILLIVVMWILINMFHRLLGVPLFDSPPFAWLQDTVSIAALLMTVIVLVTQNRQEKFSEQRRHLDLQVTLLTERKVSKIIELLEDLRRDLPSVKNRVDAEADAMQEPVDPHTALTALNHTLEEATKEYELEIE